MSLTKFADDVAYLRADGKVWVVHMHKRSEFGSTDAATAAIFATSTPDATKELRPIAPNRRRLARRTAFGKTAKRKRVDLDDFRRVVRGPVWGDGWTARPREILGGIFDLVLISRALRSVPHKGRVTVEVATMKGFTDGTPGHLLRILGKDWRIVVAGRRETEAKPLALPVPSESVGIQNRDGNG